MLIAVIGKTNVGKSTYFKAATLANVEIANRSFVTLKPNHAVGYVNIECADKDLKVKCEPRTGYCYNNQRFIPVELLDIPGLIENAHQGAGLGLSFLNAIREADALIQVVDVSGMTNEKGEPTQYHDPRNDVLMLEKELDEWFYGLLKKNWDSLQKQLHQKEKELKKELFLKFSGLKITEEQIESVLKKEDPNKDLRSFCKELRKLSKPMLIVANKIDIPGSENNLSLLQKSFPNYMVIPCSAEAELALKEATRRNLIDYAAGENQFKIVSPEITEKQKDALRFLRGFLKKYNATGLQESLNKTIFSLLKYIPVYPVENENRFIDKNGDVLPDVHLLKEGSTALDLAYKIHTDIGKKFLYAIDAKNKRRLKKDYVLESHDIIKIVTT